MYIRAESSHIKALAVQPISTFTVYNASAGSGKTFTLVKEYLKILLQSEDTFRFQKILAITFTNKAAGEMKERILNCLQDFSQGNENSLLPLIIKEINIDKQTLKKRSSKILEAILQYYTAFSIMTIDSFTYKIVKNFAYDLGLSLNFEVELDPTQLLSDAVDMVISTIGTDKQLTNLLIDFSLEKTDDDKSWDITQELNEFAKILLHEEDALHFKSLEGKTVSDFLALKQTLYAHQKEITKRLKNIGSEGLHVINEQSIDYKDFYYSMLPKHFVSLQSNPRTAKFFDQSKLRERIEEATFYSKSKPQEVKTAIESVLPKLLQLYIESEQLYQQWVLNELAIKSIVPLAVLNHIYVALQTLKQDHQIQLNAEFNQLIAQNIKGQPAPFIYERIGQRFSHYFIDEMQDTSVLQWQNLISLIDNALSQENSSLLLVGDGKQAIYRWRGGKADQFINLASTDNPFQAEKQVKLLYKNYRSYDVIIQFNNMFFQHVANFLQNESYKQLFIEGNKQLENTKKGGCVSISFLKKQEDKQEHTIRYAKKVLETIQQLKTSFSLAEICVLVRKRSEGVTIAHYLSEQGIPIISSETLLLSNSAKVNFLVNMLQIFQYPSDEETRFELLYFLYHHLHVSEQKHTFLQHFVAKKPMAIFNELQPYGVSFDFFSFQYLPLYEKMETIIRGFRLLSSSDAYVQSFLDVVLEQQQKGADTDTFLNYWEEKKHQLSIAVPDNSDAIQIMTIHKSKGLEFPVVIFPCDVAIYRQINPKIWFDDLPNTFNGFKELLINFTKDIRYINDTGAERYQQVQEVLELDNFNLLYVALTRSVEQLHIITDYNLSFKGEENLNYYSGIFINYLKSIGKWQDDQLEYRFGNAARVSQRTQKTGTAYLQKQFISNSIKDNNVLLLATTSKFWDTQRGQSIEYGNLIHQLLADIHTIDDVEPVVNQYVKQGVVSFDEKLTIQNSINKLVNHPILKPFYQSDNLLIYTERALLNENGQILIPDRLVFNDNLVTIIDYKTGNFKDEHQNQINEYGATLSAMNYQVHKKLLVYINKTLTVKEID